MTSRPVGGAGAPDGPGRPAAPARPLPAGYLRTDAVTAALLAALGALMSWLSAAGGIIYFDRAMPWQVLGSVLLAVPLIWRRRWPLTTGMVQALAYGVLSHLTGFDLNTAQVVLFLSFFSIGAWSVQRERATRVRVLICVGMGAWLVASFVYLYVHALGTSEVIVVRQLLAVVAYRLFINIAFFAGAWYFGDREWVRAVEHAELERAYADIRGLRAELVEAAVGQERLRIARELHDVVAHHVTTMSVQAAAARRLLERDPQEAAAPLRQIESAARQAVTELRALVLTLRSDGQEGAPPTVDDIPQLVEQARLAGTRAAFEQVGGAVQVSPVIGLVLYRVAQEGLTNAAKHAGPGASVAVRLRVRPELVELEVSDDGYGGRSRVPGTGTGLVGMRERVVTVGGTLEAGTKPRGGFRVRARIPVGDARTPVGEPA
ncbi:MULTISPECIES: sensor histidine kinase [unclassified Actinomyces]|uniref:sensor histidine kinase n=1 Tax=unclassified Actinomyces TaxID=2609248 RepID=UPI002016C6EB|nr:MULTISPECIES: sensor histidine kinase [unclassified Actinomyces]MCL3778675.1 sensor histidine kinase [Actinomyces sp. AC-20-1]MCL3790120.1 sensor histidine kinase [Actinomyces sp. 187325]MCL3791216.1 sensor histidine kinase [Actinomyces sp. 186855]MCL3794483.1 sensor histidine kinase [Actinomyces sp. 217892]